MKKRNCLIFTLLMALSLAATAQNRRFESEIYTSFDRQSNYKYGQAVNLSGNNEELFLDIYQPPIGDTMAKRPLIIFIHGGGFQNGSKVGNYTTLFCGGFAKRGYVVASIDYRQGIGAGTDADYFDALYRGVQDAKAAVRFFRKNAVLYGIDTTQIFLSGSSAGSKIAMHLAYLDQNEVSTSVNTTRLGTLEGVSGNAGFASNVHAVMNCWGAMVNFKWINRGDVPLFNVSGTADATVPYDSSYSYHGFKYGASILYQRALSVGVSTGLRLFANAGHTLDNNAMKQDSAIRSMAAWLFKELQYQKTTSVQSKNEQTLQVYPSIAYDFLIISSNYKGKYAIFDLLDRQILRGRIEHDLTTVDVRSLISGTYILQIGLKTVQFIKK